MIRQCELIVAMDVPSRDRFEQLLEDTQEAVQYYKVGLITFTRFGPDAVGMIKQKGKKVFFDLKFYDIPNTMIRATMHALRIGADMVDFHLSADLESLKRTVGEIRECVQKERLSMPLLIGVTVLTSTQETSMILPQVIALADKAQHAGFDGVVVSGREAYAVREKFPKLKIICPGIRYEKGKDDQRRVVTPSAVKDIVDFIVMGRPVYTADNPRQVVDMVIQQLKA